jgi:hypothetical protein
MTQAIITIGLSLLILSVGGYCSLKRFERRIDEKNEIAL